MIKDQADDSLNEKEAAQRRDDALRRALKTPPKPRHKKPNDGGSKAAPEPHHKTKGE